MSFAEKEIPGALAGRLNPVREVGQEQATNDAVDDAPLIFALPADDAAPAIARRYFAQHAIGIPEEITGDAMLLVSELVTNAVQHGRPDILLTIRLHPPGIGVAVQDHGPDLPARAADMPNPTAPQGRGLQFLDALSTKWGVEPVDPPPGKVVWFELVDPSVGESNG